MTQNKSKSYTMVFGKNMKEIREFLGLSQTDLANKTGLTCPGISMLENGQRDPSFDTIIKILDAFGVTFERMIKK